MNKPRLPDRAYLLPDADAHWEGTVRIPAILAADGSLKPLMAATWPKVNAETVVDIVIPVPALADASEREALLRREQIPLLPAPSRLMIRVNRSRLPSSPPSPLHPIDNAFPKPGVFASVTALGPVTLCRQAGRHSFLAAVDCEIPALRRKAVSLNEAYRRVSEVFEPTRRSHGGNVFLNVYYLDEGVW